LLLIIDTPDSHIHTDLSSSRSASACLIWSVPTLEMMDYNFRPLKKYATCLYNCLLLIFACNPPAQVHSAQPLHLNMCNAEEIWCRTASEEEKRCRAELDNHKSIRSANVLGSSNGRSSGNSNDVYNLALVDRLPGSAHKPTL
jgi:hypothetical protein